MYMLEKSPETFTQPPQPWGGLFLSPNEYITTLKFVQSFRAGVEASRAVRNDPEQLYTANAEQDLTSVLGKTAQTLIGRHLHRVEDKGLENKPIVIGDNTYHAVPFFTTDLRYLVRSDGVHFTDASLSQDDPGRLASTADNLKFVQDSLLDVELDVVGNGETNSSMRSEITEALGSLGIMARQQEYAS